MISNKKAQLLEIWEENPFGEFSVSEIIKRFGKKTKTSNVNRHHLNPWIPFISPQKDSERLNLEPLLGLHTGHFPFSSLSNPYSSPQSLQLATNL